MEDDEAPHGSEDDVELVGDDEEDDGEALREHLRRLLAGSVAEGAPTKLEPEAAEAAAPTLEINLGAAEEPADPAVEEEAGADWVFEGDDGADGQTPLLDISPEGLLDISPSGPAAAAAGPDGFRPASGGLLGADVGPDGFRPAGGVGPDGFRPAGQGAAAQGADDYGEEGVGDVDLDTEPPDPADDMDLDPDDATEPSEGAGDPEELGGEVEGYEGETAEGVEGGEAAPDDEAVDEELGDLEPEGEGLALPVEAPPEPAAPRLSARMLQLRRLLQDSCGPLGVPYPELVEALRQCPAAPPSGPRQPLKFI